MAIGILSLGVLAIRDLKLTFGFFVLSFLGVVPFSFYIFSILKEIKELKQIKGK
ncbi:histidine kinase [Streptococcus sp. HMSC074F05]|uniref:histidine kinase n=1 Tax=Streptococcus sp. HMSC074F05 TaxID=1715164 RepID=UPI001C9A126A|nr:histidine kinase [Streptococcus sp. HMSC074F05]